MILVHCYSSQVRDVGGFVGREAWGFLWLSALPSPACHSHCPCGALLPPSTLPAISHTPARSPLLKHSSSQAHSGLTLTSTSLVGPWNNTQASWPGLQSPECLPLSTFPGVTFQDSWQPALRSCPVELLILGYISSPLQLALLCCAAAPNASSSRFCTIKSFLSLQVYC